MNHTKGWLKLHRSLRKNSTIMKDADHLAVWIWLLTEAEFHEDVDVDFNGSRYRLKPGEFTTGRKIIASELHISESKVQRILKRFENEHQIEQRTDRQCRLISIVNWDEYQDSEQRGEQRLNNERTTSEQRLNTNQEYKNNKNIRNDYLSEEKGFSIQSWGNPDAFKHMAHDDEWLANDRAEVNRILAEIENEF